MNLKTSSKFKVSDTVICDVFSFKNIETLNKVKDYYEMKKMPLKEVSCDIKYDKEPKEYYDASTFAYMGKVNDSFELLKKGDFILEANNIDLEIKDFLDKVPSAIIQKDGSCPNLPKLNVVYDLFYEGKITDKGNKRFPNKKLANKFIQLLMKKAIFEDKILTSESFKIE